MEVALHPHPPADFVLALLGQLTINSVTMVQYKL